MTREIVGVAIQKVKDVDDDKITLEVEKVCYVVVDTDPKLWPFKKLLDTRNWPE